MTALSLKENDCKVNFKVYLFLQPNITLICATSIRFTFKVNICGSARKMNEPIDTQITPILWGGVRKWEGTKRRSSGHGELGPEKEEKKAPRKNCLLLSLRILFHRILSLSDNRRLEALGQRNGTMKGFYHQGVCPGGQKTRFRSQFCPLTACLTLEKCLNFSEIRFPLWKVKGNLG